MFRLETERGWPALCNQQTKPVTAFCRVCAERVIFGYKHIAFSYLIGDMPVPIMTVKGKETMVSTNPFRAAKAGAAGRALDFRLGIGRILQQKAVQVGLASLLQK